ncbi:hypothetical protein [Thermococcus henrietii]|nr:hypothetical protein [Thermococcus henrietii]
MEVVVVSFSAICGVVVVWVCEFSRFFVAVVVEGEGFEVDET